MKLVKNLVNTYFKISKTFSDNIEDILCPAEYIKNGKVSYLNLASSFDIETTSLTDSAYMWAWSLNINGKSILGRDWKYFIDCIEKITKYYKTTLNKRFVIYVENLGFEFQFFKHYFKWHDVIASEARKPIAAITKSGIEFRCLYKLTDLSLEENGKLLTKYRVTKKVGQLDYYKIRHSETPLTDLEKEYILYDTLTAAATVQEYIEEFGDITKLNYTQTGLVRDRLVNSCLRKGDNRFTFNEVLRDLKLDVDSYKLLRKISAGGHAHFNFRYKGVEVNDVFSFDRISAYPATLVSEEFPMSTAVKYTPKNDKDFIEHLKRFCCIFEATFTNLKAKYDFEQYVQISKCLGINEFTIFNDRVAFADKVTIVCTEQDFWIINKLYDFDSVAVNNFHFYYKARLPKDIIQLILELYKAKTELKDIPERQTEYNKAKKLLNRIFGVFATDPCKDSVTFSDEWETSAVNITEKLIRYNKSKQKISYYPWGIWTAAYNRTAVIKGILEFKHDWLYTDTDSMKVINPEKHQDFINSYNQEIFNKVRECLEFYELPEELASPFNKHGIAKPLGVWELESVYKRFKVLRSKQYIAEKDSELEFVVSGVNKVKGKEYLFYKYKTIDKIFKNFTENLIFPATYTVDGVIKDTGRLLSTYIDFPTKEVLTDYLGNSLEVSELSSLNLSWVEGNLDPLSDFTEELQGITANNKIKGV